MGSTKDICGVCAWRENCRKKFLVSGRNIRCPDFVRDLRMERPASPPGHGDRGGRP